MYEIDPSPSSPRLEVSLCDDYESSLPLEPDFMVDSPLTGLEEVIDPPLTSLPFIALSLSALFSPPFSSMHGARDRRVS